MQPRFTLFIDESGDSGIASVRGDDGTSGASPYMTMGAVLIPDASFGAVRQTLDEVRAAIGKRELHCNNLGHYQKLFFIRELARHKKRLFGVISYKKTLGTYKAEIEGNNRKYYNKCAQYLLERVGWFMEANRIPPESLSIVFEKGNFDYDKLATFLRKCQQKPLRPMTVRLKSIVVKNISAKAKSEEPLLEMADLVAHALYKCVDKQTKNHFISEPRYLRELSPSFFGDPITNEISGAGLYLVHNIDALNLDDDVREVIRTMRAEPRGVAPGN